MNDMKMKGMLAYWQDEIYEDFGDLLKAYPLPTNAEVCIGWYEAVDEVMFSDIHVAKLVVCPKTGSIVPEYYLPKVE